MYERIIFTETKISKVFVLKKIYDFVLNVPGYLQVLAKKVSTKH